MIQAQTQVLTQARVQAKAQARVQSEVHQAQARRIAQAWQQQWRVAGCHRRRVLQTRTAIERVDELKRGARHVAQEQVAAGLQRD